MEPANKRKLPEPTSAARSAETSKRQKPDESGFCFEKIIKREKGECMLRGTWSSHSVIGDRNENQDVMLCSTENEFCYFSICDGYFSFFPPSHSRFISYFFPVHFSFHSFPFRLLLPSRITVPLLFFFSSIPSFHSFIPPFPSPRFFLLQFRFYLTVVCYIFI